MMIRSSRRLLLIFAVTILIPGIVLGIVGTRAILQERRLADEQLREKLAATAEDVGRRLEFELRDWQEAIDELSRVEVKDASRWPSRVRQAVESGDAVVLDGDREHVRAFPRGRLLYALSAIPSIDRSSSDLMIQAE